MPRSPRRRQQAASSPPCGGSRSRREARRLSRERASRSAHASPEVTASIRRTPAPTEPSERTTNGPISAVDLTCVPPQSSVEKPGISTTRTMSPYFSPKSIIAPSRRASSIGVSKTCTGRFWKTFSLTICSTRSRSSTVSACSCVKSKRSLSGRTAEPAWRTWSPSVSRSAWWRTCVAVWFAIVGKRTFQGTTARHAITLGEALAAEEQRLVVAEPVRLDELGTGPRLVVELDPPVVADLAAAGRVERRLAQLREEEPVVEPLERADLREDVRLRVADELRLEARRARELGGPLDIALRLPPGRPHGAAPSRRGSRRRRRRGRAPRRARP